MSWQDVAKEFGCEEEHLILIQSNSQEGPSLTIDMAKEIAKLRQQNDVLKRKLDVAVNALNSALEKLERIGA